MVVASHFHIPVLLEILLVHHGEQLGSDQRETKTRGERPTTSIMANALDVVERLGNGMVVVLVGSDLLHFIQVKYIVDGC